MFCSRCGTQIDPHYKYCPSCGATVSSSSSEQVKIGQKKTDALLV